MSITSKFQLTRVSNIYYSGEVIEGTVTVCSLKLRQVEAIYLQFFGQTNVAWLDMDKTIATDSIEHNDFSTQEIAMKTLYSNQQKHVCEQHKLDKLELLQPNVDYSFEFSFLIPQEMPATSRCPLGECEYALQLIVQRAKKVNKEFHQRIVVKNKLDLSQNNAYTEPQNIVKQNDCNEIVLTIPGTGFTPGQKLPYHVKSNVASQTNCKIIMQLNCFITCRSRAPCNKVKIHKQNVNLRKHSLGEINGHFTIPLDSKISNETLNETLILKYEYFLEALLINESKHLLLKASIPLIIGTTPCFECNEVDTDILCYDNLGSIHYDSICDRLNLPALKTSQSIALQLYESMWLLPVKRKTHLRRSLRYCYKKILKFI